MSISRRRFLSLGGATVAAGAAVAVAGPAMWRDLVDHQVHQSRSGPTANRSRVLVVIDLGGGNDGLNTLVPSDGRYRDARPTLGVPEKTLLALEGTTAYALNPALAPLQKWWGRRQLVAVDGLAIPDQSRSHFMASDVWWTAEPDDPRGTGWLGRWLDSQPDAASNPLRGISLGLDTLALTGHTAMATVVSDPASFSLMAPAGADADAMTRAFLATARPASSDGIMAASQQAVPDAIHAIDTLTPVLTGSKAVTFPSSDSTNAEPTGASAAGAVLGGQVAGGTGQGVTVTGLLEVAAGIIDLGIGTQVIMVSVTGFDTHADQTARQPPLLTDLAQGLDGFLVHHAGQGPRRRRAGRHDQRVRAAGRAENGSGTDHGEASVQFLAGAGVNGGKVVGTADLAHLDDGDLPIQIDTRSVYAAALDWLGGPTDDILGHRYDRYDLMHGLIS